MTQLESILTKLEKAKATAAINPEEPQYARTKNGIETRVKKAKEELKVLTKEYERAVLDNGVAIFLSGPADKTETFAKLVTEMGEAVVVDANEMYARIAKSVESSFGTSREFSATQAAIVQSRIQDIAHELGTRINKRVAIKKLPTLPTKEATLEYIRDIIRYQLGDVLSAEYLKQKLTIEAEKIRYMLSVAPVIIRNATSDEIPTLGAMFGKGQAVVNIQEEEEVTEEYIKEAFQNVQKSIKKKQ